MRSPCAACCPQVRTAVSGGLILLCLSFAKSVLGVSQGGLGACLSSRPLLLHTPPRSAYLRAQLQFKHFCTDCSVAALIRVPTALPRSPAPNHATLSPSIERSSS